MAHYDCTCCGESFGISHDNCPECKAGRCARSPERRETAPQQPTTIPLDPVPMLIHCPMCCERHIDDGEFATKPHHTHACQGCGHVWRPAIVATVGVQFLPGYKND